jgi:hypothetical protein
LLAHKVDDAAHLLRRALLVGVDRPQVELLQAEIAGQVGERGLRLSPASAVSGMSRQHLAHRLGSGIDLRLVAAALVL